MRKTGSLFTCSKVFYPYSTGKRNTYYNLKNREYTVHDNHISSLYISTTTYSNLAHFWIGNVLWYIAERRRIKMIYIILVISLIVVANIVGYKVARANVKKHVKMAVDSTINFIK